MEEYNIDELVKDLDVEMHDFYNGIYLTKRQAQILKEYGFDYNKYTDMKSLIFDINNYLEEVEVLENRIYKLNYLYFLNISTKEFAEVIKRYILETNEEIKKEIREEYS